MRLRPDWYDEDDGKGKVKVVMTGSAAEGPRVAQHARNKAPREALAKRFRDPNDAFEMTIDWMVRENVRAQLRVIVKRILRRHGYPPDKQEKATRTVLEQAELLSGEWAAG